jgi:hypothetical protein
MVLEDEDEYEHENDSPTSESRFICYWLLAIGYSRSASG